MVGLGILQIDFLMGHIEITADNHRLFPVQPPQIIPEGLFPDQPVFQPLQRPLGIRRIHRHAVKLRILQGNDPSLMVMLLDSQSIGHLQRLLAAEHRRTGIALLLRTVPILGIAVELQDGLLRLHLRFLQAENIRIQRLEGLHESLGKTGPQTIDIPGNELHLPFPSITVKTV